MDSASCVFIREDLLRDRKTTYPAADNPPEDPLTIRMFHNHILDLMSDFRRGDVLKQL